METPTFNELAQVDVWNTPPKGGPENCPWWQTERTGWTFLAAAGRERLAQAPPAIRDRHIGELKRWADRTAKRVTQTVREM